MGVYVPRWSCFLMESNLPIYCYHVAFDACMELLLLEASDDLECPPNPISHFPSTPPRYRP